jgi:BlaI family transcriptional regulator, penicillinase repressor
LSEIPQISKAEWEVMKILWTQSPLTSGEVVEKLKDSTEWNPRTIKTLINRLVQKEALDFKVEGRAYLYYPTVTEEECAQEETVSFLEKVYNGSINLMVMNFIKQQKLSQKEIEDLKNILDENDN